MNPTLPNSVTIYTIGHSNILASSLIGLLNQFGIRVVVDVRSSPYSQYATQYNRETLEKSLREAGIDYKYAGDYLGGRPTDPTCYKAGVIPEGKADYLHLVDYAEVMKKDFFLRGIQRLLEIASTQRTAVLCSEADPAVCHRHHLIGKYLLQQGHQVIHILGSGESIHAKQLPDLPGESDATQLSLF